MELIKTYDIERSKMLNDVALPVLQMTTNTMIKAEEGKGNTQHNYDLRLIKDG